MRSNQTSRERGIGLLMTLIALSVLTVIGLGLTTTGRVAFMISGNAEEAIEAGYIAEAGLTHARELIAAMAITDYTPVLQAVDGTACNGDELSAAAGSPITAGGHAFGGGQYLVSICDDNDDADQNSDSNSSVRVLSTGTTVDGATATLELMLSTLELPGFLVDGNLKISGNPNIMGVAGSVHSNGNLEINGNPCAQLHFSSASAVVTSGNPDTGASCNEGSADVRAGEDSIPMPVLDLPSLKTQVTYVMKADGKIYNQAGAVVAGMVGGGNSQWNWDSGNKRWIPGNNVPQASYYAEGGSINVSGNLAGTFTLIAEGWIDISGNPDFNPALVVGGVTYSLVAGYDLKISGNPSNAYEGLHYAGHQIDFSGNPTINGQVFAANLADTAYQGTSNLVQLQSGYMSVSGNPTITYNGGGGFGGMQISGWREIRN